MLHCTTSLRNDLELLKHSCYRIFLISISFSNTIMAKGYVQPETRELKRAPFSSFAMSMCSARINQGVPQRSKRLAVTHFMDFARPMRSDSNLKDMLYRAESMVNVGST